MPILYQNNRTLVRSLAGRTVLWIIPSVTYRSYRNHNGYFFGTSQASPHVAGLAALVKQRFPEYDPQQIAQYLKDNADARGAAPNNTWGDGFAKLPAIAPEPEARLLARYDTNGDGEIDDAELNRAIDAYLDGDVTDSDLNILIDLYLG